MAGDGLAFQRYLQLKKGQWSESARQEPLSLAQYIRQRGVKDLANEMRSDDVFLTERICDFVAASSQKDAVQIIASIGGYWDPEMAGVAIIILEALKLACSSQGQQSWAVPLLAIAGIGLLVYIISVFGEG